jgi:cysteine sulfinate desulfinase/cysteine desulfurase-like protein
MGVANELAAASLRFSVSAQTTAEEVAEAARRILNVCNNLRALQERGNPPPPSPVAAAKGV